MLNEKEREVMYNLHANRLKAKLRNKMYASYNRFLAWYDQQPQEVVQKYACEYIYRDAIMLWMGCNHLEPKEALALLRLHDPLTVLFHDLEHCENTHLRNDIDFVVVNRVNREIKRQREKQFEHCR